MVHINILKNISIFSELSKEELEIVSKMASSITIKKNEIVSLDGFNDNHIFAVIKGRVEVVHINDGVAKNVIACSGLYETFGEVSLIDDCIQSEKIVAMEDSELLMLKSVDVKEFLKSSTNLAMALLKAYSKHFDKRANNKEESASSQILHRVENCWNRIGVLGGKKAICNKLENVIHCRNCDVFTKAGKALFSRSHPEGYLEEWSKQLSREKEVVSADSFSLLIFRLGAEWLALPTSIVKEVVKELVIKSIPFKNKNLLSGMVNIRGEIQLCVSIRHLLGIENSSETKDDSSKLRVKFKRMIFIGKNDDRWVFQVDEVYGIHKIFKNELNEVPVTTSKSSVNHTKGIFAHENISVGLLDSEMLFKSLHRSIF